MLRLMKNYIATVIYVLFAACVFPGCMGINDVGEENWESMVALEAISLKVEESDGLTFAISSTLGGRCISGWKEKVACCGFYYREAGSKEWVNKVDAELVDNILSADISLKGYDKEYEVCSFISSDHAAEKAVVSEPITVKVRPLDDYVGFGEIGMVSYDSTTDKAIVSFSYEVAEGVEIDRLGLCYGLEPGVSLQGLYIDSPGHINGVVEVEIPGIEYGKDCWLRPYVFDGEYLAYGVESSLNVSDVPSLSIEPDVSELTSESAVVHACVVDDCGKEIIERGFVYIESDRDKVPLIDAYDSYKVAVEGGVGDYSASLTGLLPNESYRVRAYARNEEGVAYSVGIAVFTTKVAPPVITTYSASSISSSSADIRGYVSSDGGEWPSEYGFYWSATQDIDPQTSDKIQMTSSSSLYSYSLTGLSRVTDYYYMAYAVNSAGTSYGDVVSFRTLADSPVVVTGEVSDIKDESALFSGSITDDGGAEITDKGFVWSTRSNPNINSCVGSYNCGSGREDFQHAPVLKPATIYYVRAYARNSYTYVYGEERKFATTGDPESMSPANCFIISKAGIYAFKTVKGNGNESVGEVASADVLWETFGTSVAPSVGDLVKSVRLGKGCVVFETADTYKEGNAVIAVRDSNGEILWSWHIWFTDQPKNCVYANNAGTMMDRNLGATSATPGDVGALGLLYQWGRKDPFLGSSSIDVSIEAISTITWPATVYSSSYYGTIDYAIKNPTTFITGNTNNYDWEYNGSRTRWDATKTIYDPCPAGWRVPDYGIWHDMGLREGYTEDNDRENCGIMLKDESSPDTWYPAAGGRMSYDTWDKIIVDGKLDLVDIHGRYWSISTSGMKSYYLYFHMGGYVGPKYITYRADGQSVRCMKE